MTFLRTKWQITTSGDVYDDGDDNDEDDGDSVPRLQASAR